MQPVEDDTAVRYQMTTTIEAGSEVEHCKFVQAPPEGILLNRDEIAYTEGSHHVLLYDTNYEAIPTTQNDGEPIKWVDEAAGVFDCSEGVQFTFDAFSIIAGSQNRNGESVIEFPPNVAMPIAPNKVLLMNAHYINTTADVLMPTVDIALHQIDEADLEHQGGLLFFFDIFLKLPMQSSAHSTMRCDINHDITVTNMQSHMHARGVDFEALVISPEGARDTMYQNDKWEDVPVSTFAPGEQLLAGSRIEQTCWYENNEARDIYMGPRTTDEMCVTAASYYPADDYTSLCAGREDAPQTSYFMGAEWLGQGSVSCGDSLSCFQDATSSPGEIFEIVSRVSECVIASDPAVSSELSEAIGCTLGSFLSSENPFEDCADAYATCAAM